MLNSFSVPRFIVIVQGFEQLKKSGQDCKWKANIATKQTIDEVNLFLNASLGFVRARTECHLNTYFLGLRNRKDSRIRREESRKIGRLEPLRDIALDILLSS